MGFVRSNLVRVRMDMLNVEFEEKHLPKLALEVIIVVTESNKGRRRTEINYKIIFWPGTKENFCCSRQLTTLLILQKVVLSQTNNRFRSVSCNYVRRVISFRGVLLP